MAHYERHTAAASEQCRVESNGRRTTSRWASVARDVVPEAVVVTLLCDRAERYFSTPLFAEGESDFTFSATKCLCRDVNATFISDGSFA